MITKAKRMDHLLFSKPFASSHHSDFHEPQPTN
jgi:hypothetical protein